MPSCKEHGEHSRHNISFLNSFLFKHSNDWAITVMFYAGVHMVESILEKEYSIHCKNHKERSDFLSKLDSFPKNAYRALEREAHNSRYKNYKIFDFEVYRLFKEHFQNLLHWFNSKVNQELIVDIHSCKSLNDEWFKRYQRNDPECKKWR